MTGRRKNIVSLILAILLMISICPVTETRTMAAEREAFSKVFTATGNTTYINATGVVSNDNVIGYQITTSKENVCIKQETVTTLPSSVDSTGADTVEIAPVFTYAVGAGSDDYKIDIVAGTYNFVVKNTGGRCDVYANEQMLVNNILQGGTVLNSLEVNDILLADDVVNITTADTLGTPNITITMVKSPTTVKRTKKAFVLGDSLVCNYYNGGSSENNCQTGWGQVLQNYLTEDIEVVNLGNAGSTATVLYNTAFSQIVGSAQTGDMLILESGYNDRAYSTKDEMYASVTSMVEQAKKIGMEVILVSPNASAHDYKAGVSWTSIMYNASVDTEVDYIDLAAKSYEFLYGLYSDDKTVILADYNVADTLHSTYNGAHKWASVVAKGLADLGYEDLVSNYSYTFTDSNGNQIICQAKSEMEVAQFTFDDVDTGFSGKKAKAVNMGTAVLSEDAVSGKALKLDGSGSNYLKITDENDESLLKDYSALTFSYWSKIEKGKKDTDWVFYAAPNENAQTYNKEIYIGIKNSSSQIRAERYNNTGSRPESAIAEETDTGWKHVAVVYDKTQTSIYVNGELKSIKESDYALQDILGEESIFYLGKANWGNGEYFTGLIDEVSVYNYALNGGQLAAIYAEGKASLDKQAVDNVKKLIEAIGIVTADDSCKKRIDTARAAYDMLTDTQKALVSNYYVLTAAVEMYNKVVKAEENQKSGNIVENSSSESENNGENTTTNGEMSAEWVAKEAAQAGTRAIEETRQTITSANTDKGDVEGSTFAVLKLKAKAGKKSVKLFWSKVNGADGYIIYGAACGKQMGVITEVSASKKFYTVKKLAKGKYYKYVVVAYKNICGEKRTIETSASVHIATTGGKYGNPTAIIYSKKKISLKTGSTFTLKPKLQLNSKVKTHIAKFRYESSNPIIASVNKKGKIKAINTGKCNIYVYTQNGLYKKVSITVK